MSSSKATKRALVDAFKRLLESEPYDRVTVTAVAKQCGVSRHTFYYHFSSIEDLVAWGIADKIETIAADLPPRNWYVGVVAILNVLAEDRSLVYRLLRSSDTISSYRILQESAHTLLMKAVAPYCAEAELSQQDLSMIVDYYAAGFLEVVITWVEGDMHESPHDLARRLVPLMQAGIRSSVAEARSHPAPRA